MKLTMSEAALVTRLARGTLQRHIDAGRLLQGLDGTIGTEELRRALPTIQPSLRQQELRGRPVGSTLIPASAFPEQYTRTYHTLRERTGQRPTQLDVAEELGMSERTLRCNIKHCVLAWPPA